AVLPKGPLPYAISFSLDARNLTNRHHVSDLETVVNASKPANGEPRDLLSEQWPHDLRRHEAHILILRRTSGITPGQSSFQGSRRFLAGGTPPPPEPGRACRLPPFWAKSGIAFK
ncbi:MAG: hypothetical protein WA238_05265, partial [Methylocella sp.]